MPAIIFRTTQPTNNYNNATQLIGKLRKEIASTDNRLSCSDFKLCTTCCVDDACPRVGHETQCDANRRDSELQSLYTIAITFIGGWCSYILYIYNLHKHTSRNISLHALMQIYWNIDINSRRTTHSNPHTDTQQMYLIQSIDAHNVQSKPTKTHSL